MSKPSNINYYGTLEYGDIERTLKALADERPDYIYESPYSEADSCVYSIIEGKGDSLSMENRIVPSCIVGHLIYRLFGEFALRQVNWHCNTGGWDGALFSIGIQLREQDYRSAHLLNAAQSLQDRRAPWGEAVAAAIRISTEYADVKPGATETKLAIDAAEYAITRKGGKVDA